MDIDFFDTEKYFNELLRRFNEGGTVWIIERMDTNEFYLPPLGPRIHVFSKGYGYVSCRWSKYINEFVVTSGFLSKEDAEKYQFSRDGIEYGCPNCGHGGIRVDVTEHEFVKK